MNSAGFRVHGVVGKVILFERMRFGVDVRVVLFVMRGWCSLLRVKLVGSITGR